MKTLDVKGRKQWRSWLHKNGGSAPEIWLVYYKKDSGKTGISYEESVEEALCFGWIDGQIRRMDEARCVRRFTPRKPGSRWSASNIKRVRKLMKEGRMTAAGRAAFRGHQGRIAGAMPTRLPKKLEAEFRRHARAWENFRRFPPYYRRMATGWVARAMQEETRLRRLRRLIHLSAENKRIR